MSIAPAPKHRRWPWILGGIAVALVAFVLLFDWNWFKPLVERQASAALGRQVSIGNLHVKLGWVPHITADRVVIANPPDWPGGGNLATIERLGVDVDAMAYIRDREIVVPAITVDRPLVEAAQTAEGRSNWEFPSGGEPSGGPGPKLGTLQINDGRAHVVIPKLDADLNIDLATRQPEGAEPQIVAEARGTYAKQPITATLTGGALLSLRDAATPYPVDFRLENGPTRITLVGTVQNPLNFAGADLKLDLAGPDMSLLLPLTGIAIPKTPPYQVAGQLDYEAGLVKFTGFTGKVGSSDLAGDLQVDTKPARPVVTADLRSKLVDLEDLGGFIGSTPGRTSTPGQTPQQRREVARAEASSRLLPTTPISIPRLTAADVHVKFTADSIRGGTEQPLDNMAVNLDIVDGAVKVSPLKFGIGRGAITSSIELTPSGEEGRVQATIDFQRIDLDKLLAASGVARGAGTIAGKAVIDGTGKSVAEILGRGNGELKLYMGRGGNVSALLVNLSGLQFGNALLSALGIPTRARIQCLIADFVLRRGILSTRTLLLDTDEARVAVAGEISLRDESLALELRTDSKSFSIGTLSAPIDIAGTLKNPQIMPDLGAVAGRAGAAVALGVLLTPLAALLPTIELGIGEDGACSGLLRGARTPPRAPAR